MTYLSLLLTPAAQFIHCASPNSTHDPCAEPNAHVWQAVLQDQEGALLSVWGTGPDDVWTVGSRGASETEVSILHYDGSSWQSMPTGAHVDTLWWIHGFKDGPRFIGGEEGTIIQHENGVFSVMETPGTGTVFGIWGANKDDLWAVGGGVLSGQSAFIWHFDGVSWSDAPDLPQSVTSLPVINKVWGTAPDDVWFVGAQGVILHFDGSAFTTIDSGTDRPLFTISGRLDASLVTAVGGDLYGVIAELRGGGFQDATPHTDPPPLRLVGVNHREDMGYAVGDDMAILRYANDTWCEESTELDGLYLGLHAVWIDTAGGAWAVGGQIAVPPYGQGILVYKGSHTPAAR